MKISGESTQYNVVSRQTAETPVEEQTQPITSRLMTERPPVTLGNAIEFSDDLLALLQRGMESSGLRTADPIDTSWIESPLLPSLFNDESLNIPPPETSNEEYEVDFFGFGSFGTRISYDGMRSIQAMFADTDARSVSPLEFVLDRYAAISKEIDNLSIGQEEKDKYRGQLKKQFGIACAFMGLYEDEKNGHDQRTGASREAVYKWNFALFVAAEYDKSHDMRSSIQNGFLAFHRERVGGPMDKLAEMLGISELLDSDTLGLQHGQESVELRVGGSIDVGPMDGPLLPSLFNDESLNVPPVSESPYKYKVDFFGLGNASTGYFGRRMTPEHSQGIQELFADAESRGISPFELVLDRYATVRGEIDALDVDQEEKDRYYELLNEQLGIACSYMGRYEDVKRGHDRTGTGASFEAVLKWNFTVRVAGAYDKSQDMQGSIQSVFLEMHRGYHRKFGWSKEQFADMLGIKHLLDPALFDVEGSEEDGKTERRQKTESSQAGEEAETATTPEEAQQMWMQAIQEFLEKLNTRLLLNDDLSIPGGNRYQQQVQTDV